MTRRAISGFCAPRGRARCGSARGGKRLPAAVFLFLTLAKLLYTAPGSRAADDDLPVAGRPANFNGAVGPYVEVATQAEPTVLPAETPLTITVRITALGPVRQPPRRPNLTKLPLFAGQFFIEELPDKDRYEAEEQTWQFVYRLKPRTTQVKAIPSLPFDYFKPGLVPPSKGYQTLYAEEIPLTVTAPPAVQAAEVQGPGQPSRAPDMLYDITAGPAVLRSQDGWGLPSPFVLALLVLVPPAVCAGWYVAWRRLYPDSARLVWQRRSRAARQALRALRKLHRHPAGQQTPQAAAILADYLRRRTDFSPAEPTPAEVTAHLVNAGASAPLAEKVALFFEVCDAARFAPEPLPGLDNDLAAATQLILTLEAEPWLPRAS